MYEKPVGVKEGTPFYQFDLRSKEGKNHVLVLRQTETGHVYGYLDDRMWCQSLAGENHLERVISYCQANGMDILGHYALDPKKMFIRKLDLIREQMHALLQDSDWERAHSEADRWMLELVSLLSDNSSAPWQTVQNILTDYSNGLKTWKSA